MHACAELLQLGPTLYDLVDCSSPGSSVHGILQASILESVAMPSSRIYSPSLVDFLPISVQFTTDLWVEFPVPCSSFSLLICCIHSSNSVNVSIPVSQFIPPPPLTPWCFLYICSLCLRLYLCFASKIICTVFRDSTYMFLGSPHCGWRLLCLAMRWYYYMSAPL